MPNKLRDELALKVKAVVNEGKRNLELMKDCCGDDVPFHLVGEMDSIVGVSEDCLCKMQECFELCKQIAHLKEAEKRGDSTMAVLILMKYGSKEVLKDTVRTSAATFERRLRDLQGSLERIYGILKKKTFRCSKCQGEGHTSRWVYLREKGAPTQAVLRSFECDSCEGKGEFRLTVPWSKTLTQVHKNADEIFKALRNTYSVFEDFNHKILET